MNPAIKAVEFAWVDPWTGEHCVGWRMPWTKRRAAASFYSRQIRAAQPLAKSMCGPRRPKLHITFHREPT